MSLGEQDIGVTKAAPSLLENIKNSLVDLRGNGNTNHNQLTDKLRQSLDPFQEAPQLLDPILESVIGQLTDKILEIINENDTTTHWPYDILYTLCKVRGYKTICQFLPSQVNLLEDILEALDGDIVSSWQRTYSLLLWLSIVVLAPFDLGVFGSDIQDRVYNVGIKYLSVPGKERDAAVLVIARLVTREDSIEVLLPKFFNYIEYVWGKDQVSNMTFIRLGILQTTAMIFQLAPKKSTILSLYREYFENILINENKSSSAGFDKLKVKNLGRIATVFMVYGDSDNNVNDANDIFSYIEQVIGLLLKSLSHKDTLVRYSTSKSIARIVQKLPYDFQLDVINEIFSIIDEDDSISPVNIPLFFDQANCNSWHGALLCLAEMLRRNILNASHFKRLVNILHFSLRFEQQKLTYSLGDNVRDASCYVCWSLFRVYKNIDNILLDQLFHDLINLSIFDPEVNIRRAGSAALQEGIGRQGGYNGDIGIRIGLVQAIDYFKIGLRTRSYLEISLEVYNLGFKSIIDYILNRIICNWDAGVRRLSSQSLKGLFEGESKEVIEGVVGKLITMYDDKDIDIRHGVVYTIGEVFSIENSFIKDIIDSFPAIQLILNDFSESDLKDDNELLNCDSFLNLYKSLVLHKVNGYDDVKYINNLTYCLELTDKSIINNIKQIMTYFKEDIPEDIIDIWIQRMMNGKSSFAIALGYVSPTEKVLNSLITVIKGGPEVVLSDMLTRSLTVHSLGKLISSENIEQYSPYLLIPLNDYTIDSRGDVGSWVREAAIQECTNIYNYSETSEEFKKIVINRLLSMSVEVLSKLRICSIEHLKLITEGQLKHIIDTIPPDYNRKADIHYSHMTKIFDLDLSTSSFMSFLNSYISSAGAQHVSEDTLRGSLDALIEYLKPLPQTSFQSFLLKLTDLLDIKTYGVKSIPCTLKVISNIIDSGLMMKLNPPNTAIINKLYIRTFNSHINTKNLQRIISAIEIFSGLAQLQNYDSLKRLAILLKNTFPMVRVKSAESILEVFMSLSDNENLPDETQEQLLQSIELLEDVDWIKDYKINQQKIQLQIENLKCIY